MISGLAMKSNSSTNTTYNRYLVSCIVERIVEDGEDPITSKIQLKNQLVKRFGNEKLVDFKIIEEVHFFQTHIAIFGTYASISLEKVLNGDSYYYVKIGYLGNRVEKINHETIDGQDWLVEETCRAKILEFSDKYLPKPFGEEYDATESYS